MLTLSENLIHSFQHLAHSTTNVTHSVIKTILLCSINQFSHSNIA